MSGDVLYGFTYSEATYPNPTILSDTAYSILGEDGRLTSSQRGDAWPSFRWCFLPEAGSLADAMKFIREQAEADRAGV